MISGYPNDLQEAIETMKDYYGDDIIKAIKNMTEKQFEASSHFGAGMFIRNSWYLWWYEGHEYDSWPDNKPAIVKFFNDLGITHADDMSGIILTSTYRDVVGKDIELNKQVQSYKDFWKQNGKND